MSYEVGLLETSGFIDIADIPLKNKSGKYIFTFLKKLALMITFLPWNVF